MDAFLPWTKTWDFAAVATLVVFAELMAAGSAARKPADVCSARKPELFASTSEAAAAPGVVAAVELDPVGTVEAAPDAAAAPEAEFADEAGALEFTRVSVPAACLSIRDNEDPAAVTGSVALGVEPTLAVMADADAACEPEPAWDKAVVLAPNVKDANAVLLKLVESSGAAAGASLCPAAASSPPARSDKIPLNFASASLSCDVADELEVRVPAGVTGSGSNEDRFT